MTRVRSFLNRPIPLYLAGLVAAIIFIVALGLAWKFREEIINRSIIVSGENIISDRLEYGSIPTFSNPDFFNSVHAKFIEDKATFIEANLSEMQLTYYKDGTAEFTVPIKTKGREGSWWETPAGLYKIQSKSGTHYSAFAKVYMPYSMPFQGNFFIHGWPYYKGGAPVDSKYSGGCIRLADEDAKKLYDAVKTDAPVLVYEKDFSGDNFRYQPGVAGMQAQAYLAADLRNNFVFAERNPQDVLPVASLTKLMTALVAVEYINIERPVTITKSMIVPTSKPRLHEGQELTIYDLLHPMLTESSNEAAEAIAQSLGRERFINLMNSKAKAIGMSHSVFTDPAGREAGNVSSAEDLFALAKYLYNNRSFILKMSAGDAPINVYGPSAFTNLDNFNVFAADPDFVGGKVGMSEAAKETILSVFETDLQGTKRPIVLVVLGSPDNASEARRLLNWTKDTYSVPVSVFAPPSASSSSGLPVEAGSPTEF
ncbi:MAG: L,D-transpeptidase family protein [Candidatus Liptonbacteria bacterium]